MYLFPTTPVSAFGGWYDVPTEFCKPLNPDAVLAFIGLPNDGSRHESGQHNEFLVLPMGDDSAFRVQYAKIVGA